MEQDDTKSNKTNPLTVGAPPDLLSKLMAPLGLQSPDTPSPIAQQDPVTLALKSQKWSERVAALQKLRTRASSVPARLVLEALHDENEYVRAAAARALEKVYDQEVMQPLFNALHDPSWSVRAAAAQTLGRLGNRSAIKPLMDLIGKDSHETVRAAATEALGYMKEPVPLQTLLVALRDSHWQVREAAVSALRNADQRVPREALLAASQDVDTSVREAALLALQRIYPQTGAVNVLDHIAQSQTQTLPAPETITRHNQPLLAFSQTIKRLFTGVQRPTGYNPEQETIQYVPLPSAPLTTISRRLFPRNHPLLSLLGTAATILVVASIILASVLLFRPRQSSVTGGNKPEACPASLVTSASIGCVFFKSSLVLSPVGPGADHGINDTLEIDLANVPDPASGKSYYAWLLGSATNPESTSFLLSKLRVDHGNIHTVYREPQQNDLLTGTSVFLITEEASNVQPIVPSPDQNAWRYYDALSQTPDPNDTTNHYSLLDHLHHLLTSDPQLESLNLHGGLGIWLQTNSLAILDQAQQAQQAFTQRNAQELRTQLLNILTYLDSSVYLYKDLPAGTVVHNTPPAARRVAILTLDPLNQAPPGYLQHIGYHLNAIAANPHATGYQKTLATKLTHDLSAIEAQLQQIRTDAKTLVSLQNNQLLQPTSGTLLNTLLTHAFQVYQGQIDATTHAVKQDGVTQLYQSIQMLAAFNVQKYK